MYVMILLGWEGVKGIKLGWLHYIVQQNDAVVGQFCNIWLLLYSVISVCTFIYLFFPKAMKSLPTPSVNICIVFQSQH